jgi:hypothetical protein
MAEPFRRTRASPSYSKLVGCDHSKKGINTQVLFFDSLPLFFLLHFYNIFIPHFQLVNGKAKSSSY